MGYKEEARAIHERIDDSLTHREPMTLLTEIVKLKKVPGLTVDRVFKRGQDDMIDLLCREVDLRRHDDARAAAHALLAGLLLLEQKEM